MRKCDICGVEQEQVGSIGIKIGNIKTTFDIPTYNIELLACVKGKYICNTCMDIYHKIYALENDINHLYANIEYYDDGRNFIGGK